MDSILILARYVLLYVIIMSGSLYVSKKLDKKIEKCIIIYFSIVMLTLYMFGLFNILALGVWFVSILSIVLGIKAIIELKKEKNKAFFKEKFATTGFVFFTIIYFVFMITTINKKLPNWDQFTFWSYYTKNMYYENTLLIGKEFEVGITYPPVPNILQYFFMKVIGTYLQGIEAFSTWLLCFSTIIPLFEKIKNSKIAKISLVVISLFLPAIFEMLIFYETSYPDALIGLLIGIILYTYFFEKDKRYSKILLIATFGILSLTKSTGLYIAGIISLVFIIYEWIQRKNKRIIEFLKSEELKKIYVIIFTTLIIFGTWNIYVKINNTTDLIAESSKKCEDGTITYIAKSIINTVFGTDDENLSAAISNRNLIYKLEQTIGLTRRTDIMTTLIIFAIIFIYLYKKEIKDEEKSKFKFVTICIYIGVIIYILFLQTTYLLVFSEKEMLQQAGIERYLGSFLLGMLYFIVAIGIKIANDKKSNIQYVIIALLIALITPISSVADATVNSGVINMYLAGDVGEAENIANQIKTSLEEEDSKILLINQVEDSKLKNYMIRYYMYPTKVKVLDQIQQNTNSINNFEECLESEEYDYIYIYLYDDYFEENTQSLFEELTQKTLYKIIKNNDNIKLEKVEWEEVR